MEWYYMRQGYAMVATTKPTGHFFGGETNYSGANCPVCNIPLLLLADIDCSQLRNNESAKLFHATNRLPLYYCWRCCAEQLTYQVVSDTTIKIFRNNGQPQGDDFPYKKFPQSFPQTPFKLVPIDYNLGKLLAISQEIGEDWLSKEDKRIIKKGLSPLRHNKFSPDDVNRHQIGGLLKLIQGHYPVNCPNKDCEDYEAVQKGYYHPMKELAVICNDPYSGLPMLSPINKKTGKADWNEWVQVVFWVCESCLSIAVSNFCD